MQMQTDGGHRVRLQLRWWPAPKSWVGAALPPLLAAKCGAAGQGPARIEGMRGS
jgi:hypothetical protein